MALETTATFIGHNECFGLSAEKLKNTIRISIEFLQPSINKLVL